MTKEIYYEVYLKYIKVILLTRLTTDYQIDPSNMILDGLTLTPLNVIFSTTKKT